MMKWQPRKKVVLKHPSISVTSGIPVTIPRLCAGSRLTLPLPPPSSGEQPIRCDLAGQRLELVCTSERNDDSGKIQRPALS
ncbi:hypothetical protein SKAU_G00010700 [Synaphobranchus kaupii]|uniref:Uncharacterized protein n=1 Tax=Synaphobranchus kaupii TaxID=118154 RepID=A0A9Q1JDA9_SYNKA|nr:hypothetical protein SKAU_G00010700 [Synaphobranchus kaupii]